MNKIPPDSVSQKSPECHPDLNEDVRFQKPANVIVTFLKDESELNKTISVDDFSFGEAQKISKDFRGNLSDALIEERRAEV